MTHEVAEEVRDESRVTLTWANPGTGSSVLTVTGPGWHGDDKVSLIVKIPQAPMSKELVERVQSLLAFWLEEIGR